MSQSLVLRTTAPSAGPPGMFVLMVTVTNPLLSLTVYEIGSNQTSISGEVGGRGVGEILGGTVDRVRGGMQEVEGRGLRMVGIEGRVEREGVILAVRVAVVLVGRVDEGEVEEGVIEDVTEGTAADVVGRGVMYEVEGGEGGSSQAHLGGVAVVRI